MLSGCLKELSEWLALQPWPLCKVQQGLSPLVSDPATSSLGLASSASPLPLPTLLQAAEGAVTRVLPLFLNSGFFLVFVLAVTEGTRSQVCPESLGSVQAGPFYPFAWHRKVPCVSRAG